MPQPGFAHQIVRKKLKKLRRLQGCGERYVKIYEFEAKMLNEYSKHGTGCVLSAAIIANLAKGNSLPESCKKAKQYVFDFIKSNKTRLGYHY